ncbi:MAG TPA: flavodoxin family protein, partial [bacterium]|nr:flavodoxin family protein [bacterium]
MSTVILALSGSPRKPSFTEKLLDLCLEGMGPGLELHKFYPHRMDINPCRGCWACWTKTKGLCIQEDDFRPIAEVYARADYFLVAAPLYYFSLPATVKNVIDRFFCFL